MAATDAANEVAQTGKNLIGTALNQVSPFKGGKLGRTCVIALGVAFGGVAMADGFGGVTELGAELGEAVFEGGSELAAAGSELIQDQFG